jgi:hypothetical protein
MAIIQVWSAPSCQSGAICFGSLTPWLSAAGSEAQGTAPSFRMTVQRTVADDASLSEGRCLRVLSESRGEQWWFVTSVTHDDGDNGLVTVTAGSLRQLLAVRGLIRSGSTFNFTAGKSTVSDLLTTYVLTNLADDSLSWLSLGTIEWLDVIEIAALDRASRGVVLDSIEQATGYTVRLRAVYTGTALTGFAIDVLADPAAALETVPLSVGAQVATLKRTQDALRAATVTVPFDAAGLPMDRTIWRVDTITGTAPAWLTLRDTVSPLLYPIRQDDQLNGLYIEQRDMTRTQITDSRASDSAVQVASVGTIVAGDEITIVKDNTGAALVELTSPTGVASARGRLVASVATTVSDARRNLVRNGALTTWTSTTLPANLTTTGVAEYPRTTPASTATLALDGAITTGATSIPFRGATPGARFYAFEIYDLVGYQTGIVIQDAIVVASGSGTGAFTLGTPWSGSVPDGTTITVQAVGTANGPVRPVSFPTESPSSAVARFTASVAALECPLFTVTVGATPVVVSAAVGLTMTRNSNGTSSSALWPNLQIRNASTALVTTSVTSLPSASSTTHQTLTATTSLASTTAIRARVTAGATGTLPYIHYQGVRWLSLWLGGGTTMQMQNGSGSNAMWHRAQDIMATVGLGTRYTVTGVDLAHLLNGAAPLALGQSVRLRSDRLGINDAVKIVRLDYRFDQTESLNLELGTITPRLTGVTFDL